MKKHLSLEMEAKAFLKDYLAAIPGSKERQRIKEAIQKITVSAEQRIKELQEELHSAKEELKREREKRIINRRSLCRVRTGSGIQKSFCSVP